MNTFRTGDRVHVYCNPQGFGCQAGIIDGPDDRHGPGYWLSLEGDRQRMWVPAGGLILADDDGRLFLDGEGR